MCSVMRAGRGFPVLALVLCLLVAFSAGCREEAGEKKEAAGAGQVEKAVPLAQKPEAKPEEKVTVYALSAPEPPASAEELDLAQRRIDYVNRADRHLASLCGRYPQLIMLGVEEYRNSYTTLGFGREEPSATCMARTLAPPSGLFDKEESRQIEKHLAAMDRQRESMDRDYEKLRAYVKDTSIVDDGKLGRKLVGQIEKSFRAYAQELEGFRSMLDSRASQAQDTLLRDHPLRDHVRLAMDMVSIVRRIADGLEVTEPDPKSLDKPIARLRADIDRAERLPFAVPGATEMYYRHFLKDARGLLALLLRGQIESFHAEVRSALNAQWSQCRQNYNAFVDALARG